MADLAVVIVLGQMEIMAENYRVCILKGKLDVLRFICSGTNRTEHHYRTGQQHKVFPHGFTLL